MDKEELKMADFDQNKAEIVAISEACKQDPLYKKTLRQQYEFYKPLAKVPLEKAILMTWAHFLDRMAGVKDSRRLHEVTILCFPMLGDMLRHRKVRL